MKRFLSSSYCTCVLLGILAVAVTACAPVKWDTVLEEPAKLSWPPSPNPKKIEYLGTLHEFTPVGRSLRTVVFGQNPANELVKPVAISVGSDGRMAIADAGMQGVHFFIPGQQKYLLLTKAGEVGLQSPVSVIFDERLNLVVSDSTLAKIFVFDADGKYVKEIIPPKSQSFVRPTGIAYSKVNGQLYVVDSKQNQIVTFNDQGRYVQSFGKRGAGKGELNIPTHIATDSTGKVYVNDAMNFRAQIFDARGDFVTMFGHHGDGSGDFAMPKGVAVDQSGTIYVAETLFDAVQLFSAQGDYLLTLGSQGLGPAEFWMPTGLFVDHDDKLYICDTYNQRIQIFQLYGTEGGGR
ncbi:MAG: 6-bladed beta-propeller [Proteobacteria bacterium]|nr:6-bladed beta-propeller [Desulfobulbaceae bacterium]MBU4151344.1 6-bladed beta-propeller [Pseudomonadota bacterium]